MTDITRYDTQIAIVGGGPVGLGLAIALAQRGIEVVLVERYVTPQPIPKGQNLTPRTMEHFHFWGAEQQLRAARTVPADWGNGGLTTYGTLLGKYHHPWMKRELVRPFYHTGNERLPQYQTEAVLRARAAEFPNIRTFYGWRAEAITEDASGVTLDVVAHRGEGRLQIRAQYVAGCDGSRSFVRETAGITQTMEDHRRLMVLLVFKSTQLHELLAGHPGMSFFNVLSPELHGYWRFFGRVDLGTTWFFHCPVPLDTTKDNFDFVKLLHDSAGAEFDVSFDHIGFWDLRFSVADSYRAGRLFIAGDAAHSHPPYGGYGINTGLEDAANLAWKLAAALQGWGSEALLDSYSLERQPVFASTARDFIAKSIEVDRALVDSYSPERDLAEFEAQWAARSGDAVGEVHSFDPNYLGSPIVFGPEGGVCSAVGKHDYLARPGHHLTPFALSDGRKLFDVLGQGFTLLALDADRAGVAAFSEAAAQLGLPLQVIEDDRQQGRDRVGRTLVLVRPDQYVAWVDDGAAFSAEAVLRRATGRA